jgi:hypothetical protein
MLILAGAFATVILYACRIVARLSGVAGTQASAAPAHVGHQDDSGNQFGGQHSCSGRMGLPMAALSIDPCADQEGSL